MTGRRFIAITASWVTIAAVGLSMLRAERSSVQAAPSPPPLPSHGLRGEYYTVDGPGAHELSGFLKDPYGIPTANKPPDAVRIDERIAFGRGAGFAWESRWVQKGWWEPETAGAVIWKGYIRLPKAGTYYVVTASSGASAVYINGARVALNGGFGGSIPSSAFVYDDPAVPQPYPGARDQYAMPLVISAARVLPIEVRYTNWDSSSDPRGIDLYWVTPEAERDERGTPIATIVPTEALYVTPPEAVFESVVSAPHTTMSSDVLYLPTVGSEVATVTIRVADKNGNPVAGKHVHVASLPSSEQTNTIVQPAVATDARGITTAQFKTSGALTSHLFATVVEEPVDVGQVVEIIGLHGELSFLPRTYAPYYGSDLFKVEPLPMRVGQPVHLRVPLMSHKLGPYAVHVRAYANPPSIGAYDWSEVGRTETFTLQPGESREVTIAWTPTEESGHLCFKIEVWGQPAAVDTARREGLGLVRAAYAQAPVSVPNPPATMMDTRTHNIGPVTTGPLSFPRKWWHEGGPWEQYGDVEAAATAERRGIPRLPRLLDKDGNPTNFVRNPANGKPMPYSRQKGPDGQYIYEGRSAGYPPLLWFAKTVQAAADAIVGKETKGYAGLTKA